MCGAPCSGKTTWIKKNMEELSTKHKAPVILISRDLIRVGVYGSEKHKQNKRVEDEVSRIYYKQLSKAITLPNAVLVLDNTHMKESYFISLITTFRSLIDSNKASFHIKFMEAPYWKMYLRNISRSLRTGKWIPIKYLKQYKQRSNELKQKIQTTYKQYIYE